MRTKRFSSIAMGIGRLAVGQVANLIGTPVLSSRVSDLEHDLEAANAESIRAQEQLGSDISLVAGALDLNAASMLDNRWMW